MAKPRLSDIMNDMEHTYSGVLGKIKELLSPEGPLKGLPEVALKVDAIDLKLRSWKFEYDHCTMQNTRQSPPGAPEFGLDDVQAILKTLESHFMSIGDGTDRDPRAIEDLLFLIDAEIGRLDEIEGCLDAGWGQSLSPEQQFVLVDATDMDANSYPEFDIAWRPDDLDSPDIMYRLLDIRKTDSASELLRAARLGHICTTDALVSVMQWDEIASATDSRGRTALEIATAAGHKDVVQSIMSKQPVTSRNLKEAPRSSSLLMHNRTSQKRVQSARDFESPDLASANESALSSTSMAKRSTLASTQMTDSRQLSRLAASAEYFADTLKTLRDVGLRDAQRDVSDITGAIGELYRISTILRQLGDAFEAPRYEDRIYRIQSDARLVCRSAQGTLTTALSIVERVNDMSQWMVWDDLDHRMRIVERAALLVRLRWYHNLIQGLLDQLEGHPFDDTLMRVKGDIQWLLERQQEDFPSAPISYRAIESSSNTSRPEITTPTTPRPRSRRDLFDHSDPSRFTEAPPPSSEPLQPDSPPVTWSSTQTSVSVPSDGSQARPSLYSSYDAASLHWAANVFGGEKWNSRYRSSQQLELVTQCKGEPQADAKLMLDEEGFVPLTSVYFVDNESVLTFYWRPQDGRARLLFAAFNPYGQGTLYCTPLTRLRALREDSILKLCMASSRDDHIFWTWAELNFIYHERMVLFYSTFVALKRQDLAGVPEPLIEDPRDMEEELLFSGDIRDGNMQHVLRLLEDPGSRALRLEARSSRDKKEVPIWTAFLSKYRDARDRDIFNIEGGGTVSMICVKPKPFLFVPEYGLPRLSNGDFALQFIKREDAANLVAIWTGLCTSGR